MAGSGGRRGGGGGGGELGDAAGRVRVADRLADEVQFARGFRRLAFPDKLTGHTSFNRNLRGGNTRIAVADRACVVLEAVVGRDHPELSAMCQIAYLAGALAGVRPERLLEAGFSDFVRLPDLPGTLRSSRNTLVSMMTIPRLTAPPPAG